MCLLLAEGAAVLGSLAVRVVLGAAVLVVILLLSVFFFRLVL
jgi:hypothetical protein